MRIVPNRVVLILAVLFTSYCGYSANNPPPPSSPPPPPGLPLDGNIFILVLAGLFFGVYITLKNIKKSKEV